MQPITSPQNPIVKMLTSLQTTKGRAEHGLCIVDGEKLIREHLDKTTQIFIRAGAKFPSKTRGVPSSRGGVCDTISNIIKENDNSSHTPSPRETLGATPLVLEGNLTRDKKLTPLSPSILKKISIFDTNIIATIPIPKPTTPTTPFLVLDRIQDPGNMGTILRTALAFGFQTIYTIDCADPWSQKTIRSAMGAQFSLNILPFSPDKIKGASLYIADLGGDMSYIPPANQNFGLVLGSEGTGVSQTLKNLPHTIITIPTQSVESLNVAVAGGIIMQRLSTCQ